MVPASPFYRHKEGQSSCTGRSNRRLLPESGVCSGYLLWKVHCGTLESEAPGVAVVLGNILGLAEIAPVSLWFLWASWHSLLRVPSSALMWQSIEGSASGGLALVKARTAFEGCAHADRGFCGRGSTRSRQHNGGSSAGHICTGRRRFPQCGHSDGDGGAVTGVGGQESGHGCCATWWPEVV